MNAGRDAYPLPDSGREHRIHVHRHRHSHRRRRFHYRREALGMGDYGWHLAHLDFRQLLASKGLVRLAVVVLFVGLPLAGLQISVWLLGTIRVHQWLIDNGLDALTRFVH